MANCSFLNFCLQIFIIHYIFSYIYYFEDIFIVTFKYRHIFKPTGKEVTIEVQAPGAGLSGGRALLRALGRLLLLEGSGDIFFQALHVGVHRSIK